MRTRISARQSIAEGLAELEVEVFDDGLRAYIEYLIERVDDPCCADCGYVDDARQSLVQALLQWQAAQEV
jgi:hypothetical protein